MFPWDNPNKPRRQRGVNPYSSRGAEQRVQLGRYEEQLQNTLSNFAKQDEQTVLAVGQTQRVANKRGSRRQAAIAHDEMMEKRLQGQEARKRAEQARRVKEALAGEISKVDTEQLRREREIQAICAQDPGLRELQTKIQVSFAGLPHRACRCNFWLRSLFHYTCFSIFSLQLLPPIQAAYANRERAEQLRQRKEAEAARAREEEQLAQAAEEVARRRDAELAQREKERLQLAEQQRHEIQRQLQSRHAQEQLEAIKKYAQEKQQVDALLQSVQAEQQAEAESIRRQNEERKRELQNNMAQRQADLARRQQEEAEHERRIAE